MFFSLGEKSTQVNWASGPLFARGFIHVGLFISHFIFFYFWTRLPFVHQAWTPQAKNPGWAPEGRKNRQWRQVLGSIFNLFDLTGEIHLLDQFDSFSWQHAARIRTFPPDGATSRAWEIGNPSKAWHQCECTWQDTGQHREHTEIKTKIHIFLKKDLRQGFPFQVGLSLQELQTRCGFRTLVRGTGERTWDLKLRSLTYWEWSSNSYLSSFEKIFCCILYCSWGGFPVRQSQCLSIMSARSSSPVSSS